MALSWWAGQGQRSHRERSSTLQQNALHVDIVAQDTCYDRAFLTESPRSSRKAQVRDLRRGPHRRERFNDLIPRQMAGERRARHSPAPVPPGARACRRCSQRHLATFAQASRDACIRDHRLVSAHGRARASRAATRNHAPARAAAGTHHRCRCSASLLRDVIPASHIINHTINHSITLIHTCESQPSPRTVTSHVIHS